ncbi:hypothetical protein ACUY2P_12505 [Corynebacterium hadale]
MTGSAARLGGSPGPVFVFRIKQGVRVEQVKPFQTYGEQVELGLSDKMCAFLGVST